MKQSNKYSLADMFLAAAIGACVAVAGVDFMIKHELAKPLSESDVSITSDNNSVSWENHQLLSYEGGE